MWTWKEFSERLSRKRCFMHIINIDNIQTDCTRKIGILVFFSLLLKPLIAKWKHYFQAQEILTHFIYHRYARRQQSFIGGEWNCFTGTRSAVIICAFLVHAQLDSCNILWLTIMLYHSSKIQYYNGTTARSTTLYQ